MNRYLIGKFAISPLARFLFSLALLSNAPAAIFGAGADLSISLHSHSPLQPQVNSGINYYFTVHNGSATDTASNVTVTVTTTGAQSYGASASPFPFHDNGDGSFSASIGSISPGGDTTFRITFIITGGGTVSASATVSSPDDANPANNSATESASVTQRATTDLQMVSVTVQPDPTKLGDLKRYHGVLKNAGPDTAYGITVGIQADSQNSNGGGFDDFETFVAASPAASPAAADANGIRFIPLGTIAPNTSVSFDVFYTAGKAGFVSRNFFTGLTDQETDPDLSNNNFRAFSSNDSSGSGGLSATLLTVNGSTSPTASAYDTVLTFVALQSVKPSALLVRIQTSTTPEDEASWSDLPDGNSGHMTMEAASSSKRFVLASTNYPLQNGVYFRAVSQAPGFTASNSNAVGPFDLATTEQHLGPTVLTIQGSRASSTVAPVAELHFAATESTLPAGIALHLQSSSTPEVESSWTDLADGHEGLMQQSGSGEFTLDSRNYPAGDAVYFRVVAEAANFISSVSNIIGPFRLVVDTPPAVTVSPPAGLSGSGSGADEDHPINILTGTFQITADASSGRQITNLAILYDGDALDRFGGQHGSVQYNTNVPGDHIIQAIAQDDLGTVGESAPVYLRVLPRNARIFFMQTSGDWNTASNWLDTKGNAGVPGESDLAIIGSFNATLSHDTTAYAVVVNGGSVTGPSELKVTGYLVITAGELRDMNLVIQPTATCHLINDVDVAMSGLITNLGKIKLSGSAGITGVSSPSAKADAIGHPNGFNLFAAVKNFGQWLFQRKATPAKSKPAGRVVNVSAVTNRGSVVSNTRAGLIGQDGNGLIGQDGNGLIGQDGNGLIGQDGNGFSVHRNGGSAAETAASSADYLQEAGETNLNGIRITGSVGLNGGVLSGSGVIDGDLINSGGYISPGRSPGVISVTGNFQQENNGTLVLETGGLDALQYDHLQIGGAASFDGKLVVHSINGYVPDSANPFNPIAFTSSSGSFASVSSNAQLALNPTGALAVLKPNVSNRVDSALRNISTRARVQTGDDVLIGGFIITGSAPKQVIVRALGPSLPVAGALADPILELHESDGTVLTNDNWRSTQQQEIISSGLAPHSDLESAIIATLAPGGHTVIVRGKNGGTGVGLVEIYEMDSSQVSTLGNISSRSRVQTGDDVMIGGVIVGGTEPASVIVRALGPSLRNAGLTDVLEDPTLELYDSNGTVISNDDWRATQETEITAANLGPSDNKEAAILATLVPGNYTAIVRGKDNTSGIGLVEAFKVK